MAAATAVAFAITTAATAFFAMVVTVIVAMTTAAAFTVLVVVIVLAVYVAVLQLFSCGFTDSNNFNVEVQVLASQHVVTINNNVVVINFGNFYWYWTLIGFSQETHANLQFVNTHENVFWYALHQVFIVVTVSVICANVNIKAIAFSVTFQSGFQTRDQGAMAVQIIQRCTHRRLIN